MSRKLPTYFEQTSEPVDIRIANALHKLGLAMKNQGWQQAASEGLSPTQGQILSAVSIGGEQTGTELAKRLGVTLPTVSDSVRVLVEKGYLSKKADPRNGRASLLELTAKGRESAEKTKSFPDYLTSAAAVLSQTEQEVFFTGLVKMIRTLQEEGKIPTNRMCVSCTHFRPNVHEGPMRHHCALVNAPMADRHLRVDCPEHVEAEKAAREATWAAFVQVDNRMSATEVKEP